MRLPTACAVTKTYTLDLSRWEDRSLVVTLIEYQVYEDGGWDSPSGWCVEYVEVQSVMIRAFGKEWDYKGKRRNAVIDRAVEQGEEKEIGEETPEREYDPED